MSASVHYSDDAVTLWHGDARRVSEFIAPDSVDLFVTSPPYFALRSYTDDGEHYDGQMGSEATPREFVDNLIAATADWVKVLKPTGSIWVNLGDKYNSGGGWSSQPFGTRRHASAMGTGGTTEVRGIPAKSLMGLPWRYANRVVDELGLILRECIIWQKPNGLPESVTDRCRVSHEYLFHFTRQGRYFAAMDEIREPHLEVSLQRAQPHRAPSGVAHQASDMQRSQVLTDQMCHPLGKLPGSVWSMSSEPLVVPDHLGVDHFAAFPSELPRRIILGWSPKAYCTVCDEPRRAVVEKEAHGRIEDPAAWSETVAFHDRGNGGIHKTPFQRDVQATITGYACACPTNDAPTRPAVVLDPFGGTGTTAAVAKALGRNAHGVDLSRDYLRLAEWRVNDPGIARKVLERSGVRVPKAPVIDGQISLLDGAA